MDSTTLASFSKHRSEETTVLLSQAFGFKGKIIKRHQKSFGPIEKFKYVPSIYLAKHYGKY
jgi:hypothetical protein